MHLSYSRFVFARETREASIAGKTLYATATHRAILQASRRLEWPMMPGAVTMTNARSTRVFYLRKTEECLDHDSTCDRVRVDRGRFAR